jgi:hypothetical protein
MPESEYESPGFQDGPDLFPPVRFNLGGGKPGIYKSFAEAADQFPFELFPLHGILFFHG